MENKKPTGPLLRHLDEIETFCKNGNPSLKNILNIFGPDGHYVAILFLILPFLQPMPLFGLSTFFGLMIAFISALAHIKKAPWIPQQWAEKKIPSSLVLKIARGSEKVFIKFAFLIHPRLKFFFLEPFRSFNTVLLIFNAVLLALPFPIPFSNALPAWMIFFHTLGQLEEDGIFIFCSYLLTLLCIFYFIALAKGAELGLHYFF